MIGKMYMIDVLDDGADYCFRLFGNFWQTIYGVDLTGRRLSALEASGNLTALRPVYDAVAKTREPLFHPENWFGLTKNPLATSGCCFLSRIMMDACRSSWLRHTAI